MSPPKCKLIDEIRRLNLPAKIKAELTLLASQAKGLVLAMLRFLKRHQHFAEALLLGALVAYLLTHIPWIGGFLALCALVTAAAIGVARELKEDLTTFFAAEVPAK
jgi:uncharacterized protein involved in cysteine biosynthesis